MYLIVKRDQLCGLMLRAIVALWFLWIGFLIMGMLGGEGTRVIVYFAAPRLLSAASIASFVLIPLWLWRSLMIRRVFRVGTTTQAEVTEVVERQGIHRVWYRYQWNEQTWMGRNLVKQGRGFQPVKVGERVEVALLSNRPQRSFIASFFRSGEV
jgi:hypothetical protein